MTEPPAGTTAPQDEESRSGDHGEAPDPELWAVVGNIKTVCGKGPGLVEEHSGTKHFRAGAKVFVVSAFQGQCYTVTVIGQHRVSRRWICIHMPAVHLGNLRVKLVHTPAVRKLMLEQYAARPEPPGREYAEQLCMAIPEWNRSTEAHAAAVRQQLELEHGPVVPE